MYRKVESAKSNEEQSGLKYMEVGERMRTNCESWSDEGRFYCRKCKNIFLENALCILQFSDHDKLLYSLLVACNQKNSIIIS